MRPGEVEPTTAEPVIRVTDLHKAFGSNRVLDGFSIELHAGENLAVIGRSGSGKSVLIKCVIGLLGPDKGRIEIFGDDISALSSDALNALRGKVGFLFQSNALYDSMTVRENLEFPLRRHHTEAMGGSVTDRVREALDSVGLAHTIDMMPSELSGGMCKRVALARALILQPSIILYDEPTTGLDPITAREISELIVRIRERYGTSALIISHDLRCIRIASDRTAVLVDGKCGAEGSFDELARSTDLQVHPFFS
ncbi:MAG: ATP-binding cassette domain-containing protein [Chitinophagaceae bacterium]|nr:MAG: ATP-binding cassette domain-containing protein [Chitinophagaceae bacterium]